MDNLPQHQTISCYPPTPSQNSQTSPKQTNTRSNQPHAPTVPSDPTQAPSIGMSTNQPNPTPQTKTQTENPTAHRPERVSEHPSCCVHLRQYEQVSLPRLSPKAQNQRTPSPSSPAKAPLPTTVPKHLSRQTFPFWPAPPLPAAADWLDPPAGGSQLRGAGSCS